MIREEIWRRIWAKVQKPPTNSRTSCWNWTAALSSKRSGRRPVLHYREDGRSIMVNVARAVCEDTHGPAPSDQHHAGHTCPDGENARCVNPAHLEWMTPLENERYKHARRHAAPVRYGESAPPTRTGVGGGDREDW